ncbi:hypothetical protein AALP_AA8G276200 [Arabis alpina]|uniref:Uncharacterized protein n=1 Tax=Arabis alpina TaxID=50452 RepID=A0A087G9V3_ARAAL|nr:hypothetical protein AALP_AA8G276200 [Arabis alpina]
MERPRSFRNLAPRITGSGKPPTPTTAITSTAPTTIPALVAPAPAVPTTVLASVKPTTVTASAKPTTTSPSALRASSSAKKTTSTVKGSRLPSSTRTKLVAALPAPLPSDYDAKKVVKGKGHKGDDRKRAPSEDDMIDVDREPKKARTEPALLLRRVSGRVFQDRASASRFFSTIAYSEDVVALIDTKSSREMMRQGLKDEKRRVEISRNAVDVMRTERDTSYAQIDRKNNELNTKAREIATLKAEAKKSAAAFLAEAEKSAIALAAAEEREQSSSAILKKRDDELSRVVDHPRQANEDIRSLERKFGRARDKFDELKGDPWFDMVYQVQRVANLDFVCLLLGPEPPKLKAELTFLTGNVAEHAGAEERFEKMMKGLDVLFHVLDLKEPAVVVHHRTLEEYAAIVGVADLSGSLLGGGSGGAGSRKVAVVSVDGKFSLVGVVGAEVTKSRIEDVTKGTGAVRAPEEMRTDEDSHGPRIDALIEDPRLDDVFGETEAEGVPVAKTAPPGVDEETIP